MEKGLVIKCLKIIIILLLICVFLAPSLSSSSFPSSMHADEIEDNAKSESLHLISSLF